GTEIMKPRKRKVVMALLLLTVLAGVPGWLLVRAYRQARLDHALIAAIKRDDTKGILSALNAGADANAFADNDTPPSFRSILQDFWDRILHKKPNAPHKFRPTALYLVITQHIPITTTPLMLPPDNSTAVAALLN